MVNNNTSSKKNKNTKTKNIQDPEQIDNSSQIEQQIIQTTDNTKNDIKNETINETINETLDNNTTDIKTNDKTDEKITTKRKRQSVSKDKTKKNQKKTKNSNPNGEPATNGTKKKAVSQKKKQKTEKKTEKKIDVENGENININANSKQKNRFFKLIDENDDSTGRFSGNKPKQAANKALTAIIKKMNTTNSDIDSIGMSITFKIKECTRGSKHKEYTYTGFRQKLEEPMRVTIGSGDEKKIIEYKFSNKVKKLPKSSV